MTPKQMIEGQIAEFEHLAESATFSADARRAMARHENIIADHEITRAKTLEFAAERLKGLLKLKGWE